MEDSEMIGKRFGKLVVLRQDKDYVSPHGSHHKKFICQCDCGKICSIAKEHLTSGKTRSCGCKRADAGKERICEWHDLIDTRLYRIWGNMVNRCTNPNNPAYSRYGGAGIGVCDEWLKFENFLDWANASGYRDDLTIDRIDNNSGYRPENCRWADRITQANNTSINRRIEYNGEVKTIAEWARELGMPYKVLHSRFRNGWTTERAFTQPLRKSPTPKSQTKQNGG